jgi:GNAT superfamily N-acetyltransferase
MTAVITTRAAARLSPQAPDPTPDQAGRTGIELTPAATPDTAAVVAMLSRCSRQSLYHRFHGYTDGVAYTRTLLAGGRDDETVLAWSGSTCVGFATVSCDETGRAHLGVLVEDAWQRHGIGSGLIAALVQAARLRGLTRVHADILGEDQFLLRLLGRVGPLEATIALGTYSADVELGHGQGVDESAPGLAHRAPGRGARPTEAGQFQPPPHGRANVEQPRLTA